jgi:hypothetical protein
MSHEADPITQMLTTEREQHVIVVPDAMRTDPVDMEWIANHNPFDCRIILLGKCMAHVRFTTSEAEYRELLRMMIAAGIKVIHVQYLEETNARYLQFHPDAEGLRGR